MSRTPAGGTPGEVRRYGVRRRTEYDYTSPVTASYGRVRLTPRDLPDQACLRSRIDVEPDAVVRHDDDHFGNRATYLELRRAHRHLAVTATSLVDVSRRAPDLHALGDLTATEAARLLRSEPGWPTGGAAFVLPSPRLPMTPAVRRFAAAAVAPGEPLASTLPRLLAGVRDRFRFDPAATGVTSTPDDLLQRGAGVCQDFAHLVVATLRVVGLPARYVSGYLETVPAPGRPKLRGVDASHAWVSVLLPRLGWVDLDPTNDRLVDAGYVVTAWGRDYADVPPLTGVILTDGATSTLRVAVDVVRLPDEVSGPRRGAAHYT